MKKVKEEKYIDVKPIQDLVRKLLPCPFCGCQMHLEVYGGGFGFGWRGDHKDCCVMELNESHCYGRPESMIRDWNRRS